MRGVTMAVLLADAVTVSAVATAVLGFIGQTLFLALFSTRPWRAFAVTRALMLKSFTIWLVFVRDLIVLIVLGKVLIAGVDNAALHAFIIIVNVLLVVSVWYQFFALVGEVRDGLAKAHQQQESRL